MWLILLYTVQPVIPDVCTKFQNPRSSSSLEIITMTFIRAWMNSKFSQIQSWTTELAAIERLKTIFASLSRLFNQILFILTGNNNMQES